MISQYIGRKKMMTLENPPVSFFHFCDFSILIVVMVLIGNEGMLRLMFGKVEDSVMHSCITYLRISAYSYPALAVYNAGAALFAVLENQCDHVFVGNFQYHQCYWKFHWCTCFACRCCRCCIPFTDRSDIFSRDDYSTLFSEKNEVFYRCKWIFRWNVDFMKQILKIAIPNGMENGIFQLVKVALSGIVALLEHIRLLQMVLHKVSGHWLRWRESLWVPYL